MNEIDDDGLPIDRSAEVLDLVQTLHRTEKRLETLTAGEVDSVADHEGHPLLLRHAQDRMRRGDAARQAAILDALPAHICLIDASGVVTSINGAWRHFAELNGYRDPGLGLGANYLEVCDRARGHESEGASAVAAGIRSVLAGQMQRFIFEYPADSPSECRWFVTTVTPLPDAPPRGAIVMHLNITEQRRGADALLRLGAAMNANVDEIFLIERDSMAFVHVNAAACRMQAQTAAELMAVAPAVLFGIPHADLERSFDKMIASGIDAAPLEIQRRRKIGGPSWLEVRLSAQRASSGWIIVVLVRDITERKDAQARIAYLNRVYAVLSGINTLIVRTRDRKEMLSGACRIATEAGGFRTCWVGMRDSAKNRVALVASSGMDDTLLGALREKLTLNVDQPPDDNMAARAMAMRQPFVVNDLHGHPAAGFGKSHAAAGILSLAVLPLIVSDVAVGVIALCATETEFFHAEELKLLTELADDIAFAIDHIEKQDRLNYLAYYDVLTGLASRDLFLDRVTQYVRVAVGAGHKLALFMVDLVGFKTINDSLGQAAGDSLLKQVGEWLLANTEDANLLARLGADHFAVVLPEVRADGDIVHLLEATMAAFLRHRFRLGDSEFRVSVKIGVALFPADGGSADTLYRHAEAALKKAKTSGNPYLFYTPNMSASVAGRLTMENQLRQAVENDEFVLHYQAKMNLVSGRITSAEALLRWNDPRKGLVPPGLFIPILEETGLIHEVGRWVLRKAIADFLRWREAGLQAVRIAVNVSPLQLRDRRFITEVEQALRIDPASAAGLELEITESLIMENVKLSFDSLQAIRALGVRIAIDDFGTGFSSLSYLSKLPVDTLKIDRSFIIDMGHSAQGLALVDGIVKLAHSLNLRVVAEGVETEAQSGLLAHMGCDEVQGYLYSRPIAAALFETRFLMPADQSSR